MTKNHKKNKKKFEKIGHTVFAPVSKNNSDSESLFESDEIFILDTPSSLVAISAATDRCPNFWRWGKLKY